MSDDERERIEGSQIQGKGALRGLGAVARSSRWGSPSPSTLVVDLTDT